MKQRARWRMDSPVKPGNDKSGRRVEHRELALSPTAVSPQNVIPAPDRRPGQAPAGITKTFASAEPWTPAFAGVTEKRRRARRSISLTARWVLRGITFGLARQGNHPPDVITGLVPVIQWPCIRRRPLPLSEAITG